MEDLADSHPGSAFLGLKQLRSPKETPLDSPGRTVYASHGSHPLLTSQELVGNLKRAQSTQEHIPKANISKLYISNT